MVEVKYNIFQIDPNSLLRLDVVSDENLKSYLEEVTIPSTFIPNEDFIQLSYYTLDNTKLVSINNYTNYSILSGDSITSVKGNSEIGIDPLEDYKLYYNDNSEVKSLYHFLRNPFRVQDTNSTFSVESISPDRRELRLIPISLESITVGQLTNRLEERLENSTYNLDVHLYSSNDEFYPIVNIGSREFRGTTAVVVKLAEPLESSVKIYSTFTVVEKVSNSLAFEVNTTLLEEEPFIPTLRGANFNVGVGEQTTEPSEYFNYNELFSFPSGNSNRELNSLFNEKGAELGIDYSDFSNFVNFSSIEERLRNFKYKVELLESYQSNLDIINTTGATYNSSGISGSRDYYENLLDGVVNNFDHYERSLYYESGSNSWPKSNNVKPYTNEQANSTEAISWYSTKLQEATLFDAQNVNILTNTIPSYLKEDESNDPYNLFINMIGQHFDNLWTYTDAVSKKYDADNRINRGVSKDLVEELLKNFGLKLYTSNKSAEDLFKYFIANSYENNDEYLPSGIITSGEQTLSQNDYQKEIYKRIYHNLPILLKSKGTERGLRALINCFGIPSDILKIKIYGGQSVEELPFFAGEQAWTGSVDKVRLDNTGSIVEGSTLSYYTGISRSDSKYTQDLHRIEVGFSPSDNMDSYIVSQSAFLFPNDPFNIDDYIGDPRGYESNIYPNLYKYSKIIFENVDAYDLKDFVRLIKFFDNVVFRMVKDFVPARTVTDSGIIIKPHLLEKYHAKSPVMTWTRPEYSGSIDTAFISGSNAGAYKNIGNKSKKTALGRESSTGAEHGVKTPLGRRIRYDKIHEEPKYNGELHESTIKVTNGELNPDNPFKNLVYDNIEYTVQFFRDPPGNVCGISQEEQPVFIIDPLSSIHNPVNFNLTILFDSLGNLNYEVVNSSNTATTINNSPYTYDFTNGGDYDQYDVYTVNAQHVELGEDCTGTRTVKLVHCYLGTVPGNIPEILSPNTYDFTSFISGNDAGENSDLSYYILGPQSETLIETPESYTINDGDYGTGASLQLRVEDNVNTQCSVTINFSANDCALVAQTGKDVNIQSGFGEEVIFIPNYGFIGTNALTQFDFQLSWDSSSWFLGAQEPPFTPNRFSDWINITDFSTVSAYSVERLVEGYPQANTIALAIGNNPISNLDTFTEIEDTVNSTISINYHKIRIKFRARNSETCVVEGGRVYNFDIPQELLQYFVYDPYYNPSYVNVCCNLVYTNTIVIPSYPSIADVFNNAENNNNGIITTPIYSPDPNDETQPGAFAPSGWYSDGQRLAQFITQNGQNPIWGQIHECDGNLYGSYQQCQ